MMLVFPLGLLSIGCRTDPPKPAEPVPEAPPSASVRYTGAAPDTLPTGTTCSLAAALSAPAYLAGELVQIHASTFGLASVGGQIEARVSWIDADGATVWVTGDCEGGPCLTTNPAPLHVFEARDGLPDIDFVAPQGAPLATTLSLTLVADGDGLARRDLDVVFLGGTWFWGDLHSHSRWSYDGCEDVDLDCGPRGALPGEEHLAIADDNLLDFVALTDHAESDLYHPDGLDKGKSHDVWTGQQAALVGSKTQVLPILGYEWTPQGGPDPDGHRTVLLGDATACPGYRIAARAFTDDVFVSAIDGAAFEWDGSREAKPTTDELWQALTEAEDACGPVRWLTFAHHPAYLFPKANQWDPKRNAGIERLVEIYSEHGSSECVDVEADGCDFQVNDSNHYAPGSVQQALAAGFRLGFVGGTDSHDSRPGSLEDGPGPTGFADGSNPDGVVVQFAPGGLTGALVDAEALDTDGLFDAFEQRHTVATSGPRPTLLAWGIGSDQAVYLPGDQVPPTAFPVMLFAEVPSPDGTLERIERIDADLAVVSSTTTTSFADVWEDPLEGFTYLRLRYVEAGGDDRVWVSPWFAE